MTGELSMDGLQYLDYVQEEQYDHASRSMRDHLQFWLQKYPTLPPTLG